MTDLGAAAAPAATTFLIQLKTQEGEVTGPALDVPADVTPQQLELLINELLKNARPMGFVVHSS
jgi:ribosome assembly protein 4